MKRIKYIADETLSAEIDQSIKDDDLHQLRKSLKRIVNPPAPPPKRDSESFNYK